MSPIFACDDCSLHFHKSWLCIHQVTLRSLNNHVPLTSLLLQLEPALHGWTTFWDTKLILPSGTASSPRGTSFIPVLNFCWLLVWRNDLPRQILWNSHSSDLFVSPVEPHSSLTLQKSEGLKVYLINLLWLIMAGDWTLATAKGI